ncbi:cysteine-rich receptor-like protein kinase 8 [Tanacetum coccineum]
MTTSQNTNNSSNSNNTNIYDINSIHHTFYFHQNDHQGLILISKKLTGLENYSTWKRSMMSALNARNKLKLINGKYEEPAVNSPLRSLWERANDMIVGYPPGHPLHNKYVSPPQRNNSSLRINAVNQVNGSENVIAAPPSYSDTPNTPSAPSDAFVHSRMDQLQKQLNQVLLML